MTQAKRWDELESDVVADYDVFRVRRTVTRSPRTGEPHEFHVLDVPPCVKVIPFTEDGELILVEQFRQAVQRVSLEFPAGVIDEGEDAVEAALRELEEETGYRAESAELLTDFDPDPSIQGNVVKLVVARGCRRDGERDLDEGEDVAVRLVSQEEVPRLIASGDIRHAAAITAWYLYHVLQR